MRSIQDPKKRKLKEKKPIVTSQDPDFPESLLSNENLDPPHGYGKISRDWDLIKLYESKRDEIEAYDRFLNDLEWLERNGYFVPEVDYINTKVVPINLDGEHEAATWDQKDDVPDWLKKTRDAGGGYIKYVRPEWWDTQDEETGYALVKVTKPDIYDEYKKMTQQGMNNKIMSTLSPIGPKRIDSKYRQPEIIETPPTPMPTGRQAVQIGRVAQDRENARYGQVLDKEYYWDDDLKRWQMRPVDEERLGRPFPKTDRKYRLIKASF